MILDEGSGAVLWFSRQLRRRRRDLHQPGRAISARWCSTATAPTPGRSPTAPSRTSTSTTGLETTVVDRNGLTTTFGYSGNLLHTITDPFNQVTTFTYSSGYLQSIKDPASRLTTFTMSSGDLTGGRIPRWQHLGLRLHLRAR